MANVPRSSFIPKQVTSSAIPQKVRHTRVFSIFGFLSGFLLFVSLILSAGVFLYKGIEERKLASQKEVLAAERGKFNADDIAEVRAFDDRIEFARTLLDSHVAPSKIFEALENSTKQSVQYTDFSFVRRPSGDVSVDLAGVTDDFAKVALQSLQNSEDFILKDMTVTEVGIGSGSGGEEGAPVGRQISFQLISNIPASKVLFETENISDITPDEESMIEASEETDSEDTEAATTTVEVAPQAETVPVVPPATSPTTATGTSPL